MLDRVSEFWVALLNDLILVNYNIVVELLIQGMAQMIREDVCSVMPAEYECDMHFDVYWNAIVMAMTDPTDGYWSASHLCKVGAVLLFNLSVSNNIKFCMF